MTETKGPRLACRLDALMREKQISGKKLAQLAGVTELTVGRARRDELRAFDSHTVARILVALDAQPADLFSLENDSQSQESTTTDSAP